MPGSESAAAAPAVSILLVAYNSATYLPACVGSIHEHTRGTPFEIILIDNGTDGSADLVKAQFPDTRIAPSEGNIGFGAGNNRAAALARADLLLLLNPDTCLTDPAIDALHAFALANPQAVAWGGRTITNDGVYDGGNYIAIPTLSALARSMLGDGSALRAPGLEADATAPMRVDVLCGGFMMIRRDIWEQLGGFDEGFFLYSEEIDLFTRLRTAGYQAWATPAATVIHDVGSGNLFSPARMMFKTRGQMHYARKYWGGVGAMLAGALLWGAAARRVAMGLALGWSAQRYRAMRQGYAPLVLKPGAWWYGYSRGR